jgi:hypothetical protein
MSMVAKILVVLNLFLAVAVMGAAGAYMNASQRWKTDHETLKEQMNAEITALKGQVQKAEASREEAVTARGAAERAHAAVSSANEELQKNADVLKSRLAEYGASLAGIDGKIRDLQQNLDAARAANETLGKEKAQAEADRRDALAKQNAAENEQKRLEGELANLQASRDNLAKQHADTAEALEATNTELALYKKEYPAPGVVNPVALKGQVLAANAADDVYLLSIGEKDGVKKHTELSVYRDGGHFVGTLVVYKVENDKSAAYIKRIDGKPFKPGGDVKMGDKVSSTF